MVTLPSPYVAFCANWNQSNWLLDASKHWNS